MSVISDYKKSNPDTQTTILAWVFGTGIVIAVIVGLLLSNAGVFDKDLSFAEEKEKCEEIAEGTAMVKGIGGYCDTYIGSDGDIHYKYVQTGDILDAKDEGKEKDTYIIWETGEAGKY